MKRTLFARAAMLMACLTALSGCAVDDDHTLSYQSVAFSRPVYKWGKVSGETLTIWTKAGELERTYMQRAFDRYEALTDNTVKVVDIEIEKFEGEVTSALNGGSENPPDIIASYGGTNLDKFDPDVNLCDLTDEQWVKDLTLTGLNQAIYNGKVIGLPHWEASVSGTLYNKALFEKYDIEVPSTQREFMEACDVLYKKGVTPVYLPYKEITMLLYQFPLDTIVEDSDVLHALNDGELGYVDIPEMAQIVQWYKAMSDSGYFGTDYLQNDWAGMDAAMRGGQYAMMLCWDTWLYTDFTGNPDDFGLMPAFVGVPQEGTFEGPNLSLLTVNNNSPRVEAALDFITFLADPYNYNYAFDGIYTAPVFKNQVSSISTPQYAQIEQLVKARFRNSIAWLRIKGFAQLDAQYIQKYMQSTGEYTAMDCLADMDRARIARAS